MRRKKSSSKRRSPRRRRMGAISGAGMGSALYTIAGAVAAQAVTKFVPIANDKIKAAVPVALGLFLPKLIKGSVGQGLGTGMVAVGGLKLIQSFGVLSGLGGVDAPGYSVPSISAVYNKAGLVDNSYMTPAISGLAGLEELGA
jgi:hypothetical protein